MEKKVFQCHKVSEGVVEGETVILKNDIMFCLIDPKTGAAIKPGHDLEGKSIAKEILIPSSGRDDSAVQVDDIYQLNTRGNAPKAMITQHLETVLVSSAIITEIPTVDKVGPAFYDVIKDGDIIRVDTDHSVIEVLSE